MNGALMIEPTGQSRKTVDQLCDALIEIAQEAKEKPEHLKQALMKQLTRVSTRLLQRAVLFCVLKKVCRMVEKNTKLGPKPTHRGRSWPTRSEKPSF